ncbi:MAG: TetR/AcrR family transcriptional regulator [Burkholderiaceae bacterium]
MGRAQQFDIEVILDAALEEGSEGGFERLSASAVARRLGAPSGSLYHRYPNRDAMVAALWLRTVKRFQAGYLAALATDQPAEQRAHAAIDCAFDWCAGNPRQARLLLCYRREDLLQSATPVEISREAQSLNDDLTVGLVRLASEINPASPDLPRVRLVCITLPGAVIREALPRQCPIEEAQKRLVHEAASALLASGES